MVTVVRAEDRIQSMSDFEWVAVSPKLFPVSIHTVTHVYKRDCSQLFIVTWKAYSSELKDPELYCHYVFSVAIPSKRVYLDIVKNAVGKYQARLISHNKFFASSTTILKGAKDEQTQKMKEEGKQGTLEYAIHLAEWWLSTNNKIPPEARKGMSFSSFLSLLLMLIQIVHDGGIRASHRCETGD